MGYIIATSNMKGGVGKTTLTVNLATCLVKNYGKRVLIVDLDTQISATLSMMAPNEFARLRKDKRTLRQLLQQAIRPEVEPELSVQDIVRPYAGNYQGIDLLPGDIDLYDDFMVSEILYEKAFHAPERDFESVWNRFERILIQGILEPVVNDYDFVFLDCAPGYNLLTRSSLIASDFYIIPAKPEPLSLIGMQLLERRVARLVEVHQAERQHKTQLLGVAFTMSRNLLAGRYYKQVMKRVHEDFNAAQIFKTAIPMDVNVSKAVDTFKPVVLSDPKSSGAKAFAALADEFLQKLAVAMGRELPENKFNLAKLE